MKKQPRIAFASLIGYFCAVKGLRFLGLAAIVFSSISASSQQQPGIISGNVLDEKRTAVAGATVELFPIRDSSTRQVRLTDASGGFLFEKLALGLYRLRISYVGKTTRIIDSIHFRVERHDFNLTDIVLQSGSRENLEEVVVYSEKPLVQSKDGNITFNASESALAAGSNASELLNNVPLVTRDPTGKVLVRGKEPKILIDDKPVELNLQQLQDLLESLPGSSIEKIEVMTNPPPQFANEQGGVINIVTKKGRVGKSGRVSVSAGTRGEASITGNYSYRKQGLVIGINGGAGFNRFEGSGHTTRRNIYVDSSSILQTTNRSLNRNFRPHFRFHIDYDLAKSHTLNVVLNYNQNEASNRNATEYTHINRYNQIYRISERTIRTEGESYSPNLTFTYTWKGRIPGESLKMIAGGHYSKNVNDRHFYQEFFNPDHTPTGVDSTQLQLTDHRNNGLNLRVNYDRPLGNKRTFLSAGSFFTSSNSHVVTDASYLRKPQMDFVKSGLLSNDFRFRQGILNLRASAKHTFQKKLSISGGFAVEFTTVRFDLIRDNDRVRNEYWDLLPFANFNKIWENDLNITFSYRRTIRRPGINEQNPSIDFSDPYNIRFGNPDLRASTAHNFDLVFGKTRPKYFFNAGGGYNIVENIFSLVRTLIPGEKTEVTWQNISGRREFEISTWNGLTVTKTVKANLSASYIYNVYSEFDRTVNRYCNGGSFTSNINSTYVPGDTWQLTSSFTLNRFANPQGFARWNLSTNVGAQRKFLDKRLVVTLNIIDPFVQQKIRNITYGTRFYYESYTSTQTRNFRLTAAWNFNRPAGNPLRKSKK